MQSRRTVRSAGESLLSESRALSRASVLASSTPSWSNDASEARRASFEADHSDSASSIRPE
eukprot:6457474-Prymnesium_polylepis.1